MSEDRTLEMALLEMAAQLVATQEQVQKLMKELATRYPPTPPAIYRDDPQ